MDKEWEIAEALAWGKRLLSNQTSDSSSLDVDIILASILRVGRVDLYAHSQRKLGAGEAKRFFDAMERRAGDEPVAYITGEQHFYGRTFKVTPDVLIPRPETERLVDAICKSYRGRERLRVLDLGTGSGCIAISIDLELADSYVEAWDISSSSLDVASQNAERLGSKVVFLHKDMTKAEDWQGQGQFDVIVSNPPYISAGEYQVLPHSVRQFEPKSSLLAADEGVSFYQRISELSGSRLAPGGWLYLEVGFRQATQVSALLEKSGFAHAQILKDFSGHDRVVIANWTG